VTFSESTLQAAIAGYRALKDQSPDSDAVWVTYYDKPLTWGGQDHDRPCLRWIMERRSSYYGEWMLFDGYAPVCAFSETLLAKWLAEYEAQQAEQRKAREEATTTKDGSF
jgi:hypothetical protein